MLLQCFLYFLHDVQRKRGKGELGEQLLSLLCLSPTKSPARKAAVKSVGYWNGRKNREREG